MTALETLRGYAQRGAFAEYEAFLATLSKTEADIPDVLLETVRLYVVQWNLFKARQALDHSLSVLTDKNELLHFELESVCLDLMIDGPVPAKSQECERIMNTYLSSSGAPDPKLLAKAQKISCRVKWIMMAQGFQQEDREVVLSEFKALTDFFFEEREWSEGFAAFFNYAEHHGSNQERVKSLSKLADKAVEVGLPAKAAEAHCRIAELLLAGGAEVEAINKELDRANVLFERCDHCYGRIVVDVIRARVKIEREFESLEALDGLVESYRSVFYYKGVLQGLLAASQYAHRDGRIQKAIRYNEQLESIALEVGYNDFEHNGALTRAELLFRYSDHSAARNICMAKLKEVRSPLMTASFQMLLAINLYTRDAASSLEYGHKAIHTYRAAGYLGAASDAALGIANNFTPGRNEQQWANAERILNDWLPVDLQNQWMDRAIDKYLQRALLHMRRAALASGLQRDSHLENAEKDRMMAVSLIGELEGHGRLSKEAATLVSKAQIFTNQKRELEAIPLYEQAYAIYTSVGMKLHAANCKYCTGLIFMNETTLQHAENIVPAETALKEAFNYYHSEGMRLQAADGAYWLANLFHRVLVIWRPDKPEEIIGEALDFLTLAESNYDSIRREYLGDSSRDSQMVKQTIVEEIQKIYELGEKILLMFKPDAAEVWRWCQRSKARALTDMLASRAGHTQDIINRVEVESPDLYSVVQEERRLASLVRMEVGERRTQVQTRLQELRSVIYSNPLLSEYNILSSVDAVDALGLETMVTESSYGDRILFVDWMFIGNDVLVTGVRPGKKPEFRVLPGKLTEFEAFVEIHLSPDNFRSTLRDLNFLSALSDLIKPILEWSNPEDLLVLSPSGVLNRVPLHALENDGVCLLERNPVVYVPSLSVLRHVMMRRRTLPNARRISIFGDPGKDLPEIDELLDFLGDQFGGVPIKQDAVNRLAFVQALRESDYVYFHGHAEHIPHDPLQSRLFLADGPFTADEIFQVEEFLGDLLVLSACESGVSKFRKGNEPLGLFPAFLFAGCNSVIATMWKTSIRSAPELMRHFWTDFKKENNVFGKAESLRRAALKVKSRQEYSTPYHWAAFVLYGNWK